MYIINAVREAMVWGFFFGQLSFESQEPSTKGILVSSQAQLKQTGKEVLLADSVRDLEKSFQEKGLKGQFISIYDRAATPRKIMENDTGGFDVSYYEEKAITWDYDKETDTYRLMHIIKFFGAAEETGREVVRIDLVPLTQLDNRASAAVSQNLPHFIENLIEISEKSK